MSTVRKGQFRSGQAALNESDPGFTAYNGTLSAKSLMLQQGSIADSAPSFPRRLGQQWL